jgi:hypothetical protein
MSDDILTNIYMVDGVRNNMGNYSLIKKESLNSDSQQFHPYQQSEQSSLTITRAHIGGRFGRRSRLVAAHFALY